MSHKTNTKDKMYNISKMKPQRHSDWSARIIQNTNTIDQFQYDTITCLHKICQTEYKQMLMVTVVCWVSCQANIGLQVQILPT